MRSKRVCKKKKKKKVITIKPLVMCIDRQLLHGKYAGIFHTVGFDVFGKNVFRTCDTRTYSSAASKKVNSNDTSPLVFDCNTTARRPGHDDFYAIPPTPPRTYVSLLLLSLLYLIEVAVPTPSVGNVYGGKFPEKRTRERKTYTRPPGRRSRLPRDPVHNQQYSQRGGREKTLKR